jgi:FtsH-binding integral membrane protein
MLRLYLTEFLTFGRCLLRYARYIRGVLFGLTVLVFSGGIALAYVEEMPLGDAIYFAFVTGLTIGYGDIAPATVWGRVISIGIGFVGVLFTGLYIALATRALADTKHYLNDPNNSDDSPPTKQS